jgi:hypothetical protein
MIDGLAALAVWGLVVQAIWRGYRHERRVDRHALLTWAIVIALGWLMTVRVPAVGEAINRRFDGQPVSEWLNALATLTAAGLYATLLLTLPREDKPQRRYYRWLARSTPVTALAASAILAASFRSVLQPEQAYHLIRWIVALDMFAVIGWMFLPLNRWLARTEAVMPMRVKQWAMVAGLAVYTSGTVVALVLVPLHLWNPAIPPDALAAERLVLGAMCIIILLSPHRWIVVALVPLKWRRYRRIAALERAITLSAGVRRLSFDWWRAWAPQYLEFATYLSVINILDSYRLVPSDDAVAQRLRRQIELVWQENPDYDDLVNALSKVSA